MPAVDALRGLVGRARLPGRDDLGLGAVDAALVPRATTPARWRPRPSAPWPGAGVPGRARPSRVSAAGVRARWTGGADLRLARAVG